MNDWMDGLKSLLETEKSKMQSEKEARENQSETARREIETVFRRLEATVFSQVAPANAKFFRDQPQLKFEALVDADDLETFVLFLRDFRYVSRLSRQSQIECVLERFFPEENAYLPFGIEHDFIVMADGAGVFIMDCEGRNKTTVNRLAERILSAIIVTAELEKKAGKKSVEFL